MMSVVVIGVFLQSSGMRWTARFCFMHIELEHERLISPASIICAAPMNVSTAMRVAEIAICDMGLFLVDLVLK